MQSPLSSSKSKQQYSFPKEQRFHQSPNKVCDNLYDLPSTRDNRCTTFGYGQKVSLAKSTCSPAPTKYDLPGIFDSSHTHKGFSLGLGRESVQFGAAFHNSGLSPGPGAYKQPLNGTNICYTMRARNPTEEDKLNAVSKTRPGPGTYPDHLCISNKGGKYPNSTFKNPASYIIHSSSSGTFPKKIVSPGPGTYNQPEVITANGQQNVVRFKSSGACTFAQSGRSSLVSKQVISNPGPGLYNIPTEFNFHEQKSVLQKSPQSPVGDATK